ncbi:PAS domain-containing sensor histidine kinase [Corallococcus sp. H22C18031201]|uniref:sensor histidine kinase n=1 Tax=Citreicoccus inhibens TaxID=2849499 RepID=UPI000E75D038|nr:PAS domain-containing sensor histidine kinase [Citreicoccus inhibens]MBU8900388.1 PAS domain S-box protein [Citreicoccus inhibens]RJS25336.1 PAS domain-containing sensor histidine kinase [Corallococcus sp. H22C18031201]
MSADTRLQLLREMMGEAFVVLDAHGRLGELNHRAATLLGLHPDGSVGQEPWVAQPALAGTLLHERLMSVLATREPTRFLCELPPGTWLEVSVRSVGGETWVLANDITRRQQAESEATRNDERLRQLGDRFQVALESAEMAVWETNLATGQVFRSEGHDRLYGFPQPLEEWTHEKFLASLHPDDRAEVEAQVTGIFDSDVDSYSSTFRTHWPDGSWHWLNSRAKVIRDATGRVMVVRGAVLDITALKETEAALQDAVRTRDDFLSLASHELRTPLTSLRLQVDMLRRQSTGSPGEPIASPKVVAKLEAAERQLRRLGALVDNLLDVSRMRTGKLDFHFADGDLAAVVSDLAARFADESRQAGVVLEANIESPAPGHFDRLRLEQVVNNLMTNAFRHGKGSPVHVSLTSCDNTLRLMVRDHGPGVPLSERERVFQRFAQGRDSQRAGGLGLGLYIVRQIVEAHGGRVWVEDAPGGGAAFMVELPPGAARE